MKLCKACEIASKHGAVTVGDAILYIENHANEFFAVKDMAEELMELVKEASCYGDDCSVDTVLDSDF